MDASAILERIAFRDEPAKSAEPIRARINVGTAGLCSECSLRHLCLTVGLDALATKAFEQIVSARVRIGKGETLFRPGEPFRALYAIRSGSCKSVLVTEEGREQVAGYHMRGEIVGIDGLSTRFHESEAVALEDSEFCTLPFDRLEEFARRDARLQHGLHRLLAAEVARERNVMLMLGTMRAEQRLASFLLDLSRRYRDRGYSSTEFILRMTREEIGSFLGLKLETVSRLFSRFQEEGLIEVHGRAVKLRNPAALKEIIGQRG